MAQLWAIKFYHSKQWLEIRQLVIALQYGLCTCGNPIDVVHHKIELTPENINNPEISLNLKYLVGLCQDCHNAIHNGSRIRFTETGDIVPVVVDLWFHEEGVKV